MSNTKTNVGHFTLTKPTHLLALGFGSGLLKPAPGTWGTLAAVPIFLLFTEINAWGFIGHSLMLLLSFVLGVYVCGKASSDAGVHDHSAIVWDEFVGFFITMTLVPVSYASVFLGFALFRFFDIVKPWPIKWVDQKVHGGFGIMVDDLIAGLAACCCLHICIRYFF